MVTGMMGIAAGLLFPGLDGACEELRERYFETEKAHPRGYGASRWDRRPGIASTAKKCPFHSLPAQSRATVLDIAMLKV
jgi:hypothetical protein